MVLQNAMAMQNAMVTKSAKAPMKSNMVKYMVSFGSSAYEVMKRTLVQLWGLPAPPRCSPWRPRVPLERLEELSAEELPAERLRTPPAQRAGKKGRPAKKNWKDCRSAARNPLLKSNRLQPGMERRRWDVCPADALLICRKYSEVMQINGGDQRDAIAAVKKVWDRKWRHLKRIVKKGEAYWQVRVREAMKTGRTSKNKRGENLRKEQRFDGDSRGCRAPGGGCKNRFASQMRAMKVWVDEELENQKSMEPEELVMHFEWLLERDLEEVKAVLEPSAEQICRMREVEQRLEKCKDVNDRKYQTGMIMKSCRYVYLKPQRQIKISFDEEKRRVHRTWQTWDRRLWEVVQRDWRVIAKHVVDVQAFQAQVSAGDLVLGFSDQVPWWGFVQTKKQLYSLNIMKNTSSYILRAPSTPLAPTLVPSNF